MTAALLASGCCCVEPAPAALNFALFALGILALAVAYMVFKDARR